MVRAKPKGSNVTHQSRFKLSPSVQRMVSNRGRGKPEEQPRAFTNRGRPPIISNEASRSTNQDQQQQPRALIANEKPRAVPRIVLKRKQKEDEEPPLLLTRNKLKADAVIRAPPSMKGSGLVIIRSFCRFPPIRSDAERCVREEPMYFYNVTTATCQAFYNGYCGRSRNRFFTENACKEACVVEAHSFEQIEDEEQ